MYLFRCDRGLREILRIDEEPDDGRRGNQFVSQFQPFWRKLHGQLAYAGDVAAGPAQTGDQPELHWVVACGEDDGNCGGRVLCRDIGRRVRNDHGDAAVNQIGRHRRQPVVLAPRPMVLNRYILAFGKTGVL